MDKAGHPYAIQGIGAGIVEWIQGSYTNVVGLPVCELAKTSKNWASSTSCSNIERHDLVENLARILTRIGEACDKVGRSPEEVRIVAAAKGQGRERILEAVTQGIRIFGHNYVQEAVSEAHLKCSDDLEFHMIGHLQKNKAGKAVELFHSIQTVDNPELAEAVNRRAAEIWTNNRCDDSDKPRFGASEIRYSA